MEYRILGLLQVVLEGRVVELRAAKVRALLGMLLINPNQVVGTDRLAEGLWGDDRPDSAVNTLQGYISQLRKALGPDRIQTRAPGYVLTVDEDRTDAGRFERLLDEGRRARAGGDPDRSATVLAQALELWRGQALADFSYADWAQAEIARLEELRLVAIEEWTEARLDLGQQARSWASWTVWSSPTPCERGCGPPVCWRCTGRDARPRPFVPTRNYAESWQRNSASSRARRSSHWRARFFVSRRPCNGDRGRLASRVFPLPDRPS